MKLKIHIFTRVYHGYIQKYSEWNYLKFISKNLFFPISDTGRGYCDQWNQVLKSLINLRFISVFANLKVWKRASKEIWRVFERLKSWQYEN